MAIRVIKWNELQKGQRVYTPSGDAPGAWPRGTRVRKSAYEEGDGHTVGKKGTVFSSIGPYPGPEPDLKGLYAYWISWDDHPELPCGIRSDRIELDTDGC